MNQALQEKYNELSYYTLSHPNPTFIHQYIVYAFMAQHAQSDTKPISLAFALIGLYLHLEKGYSGKDVQRAHMKLAKYHKMWPTFVLPQFRGDITIDEVLSTPPGKERDEMIQKWCLSVWQAYHEQHEAVADLAKML